METPKSAIRIASIINKIIQAITEGQARFGQALFATLIGAIVYYIVLFIVEFFLSVLLGYSAVIIAFVLAILAWLGVYKSAFNTGWLRALLWTRACSFLSFLKRCMPCSTPHCRTRDQSMHPTRTLDCKPCKFSSKLMLRRASGVY